MLFPFLFLLTSLIIMTMNIYFGLILFVMSLIWIFLIMVWAVGKFRIKGLLFLLKNPTKSKIDASKIYKSKETHKVKIDI